MEAVIAALVANPGSVSLGLLAAAGLAWGLIERARANKVEDEFNEYLKQDRKQ